jgi:nitrogen regulatory protein PII
VLEAIEKKGINKSTVLLGRRIGDDNPVLVFNIQIEPQREVTYTIVPEKKVDRLFESILEAGELSKPYNGFAFIIDVEKVGGIDLASLPN